MRWQEILSEAWRNVKTGTSHLIAIATALLLTAGGLAWLDLVTVQSILSDAEAFHGSGAATLTLVAPAEVDGRTCDRLTELDGVSAAGALRNTTTKLSTAALPQQSVPVVEATPGLAKLLGVSNPGAGVWLSKDLADTLGLKGGDTLPLTTGSATIAGTYAYPDDGRRPGLAFAIVVPIVAESSMDECWIAPWPPSPQYRTLLMAAYTGGEDAAKPPTVNQLNATLGTDFDGHQRWVSRATRWAPLGAAVAGLALGYLAIRLRRLELASARHAGVQLVDLWAITMTELLLAVLGVAAITSASLPIALGATTSTVNSSLFWTSMATVGVGCWALLAGGTIAVVTTTERHLFDYFRQR